MPYGIPASLGGDNKANTARMESCVKDVMSRHGIEQANAIAICKHSLGFTLVRAEKVQAGMKRTGRMPDSGVLNVPTG